MENLINFSSKLINLLKFFFYFDIGSGENCFLIEDVNLLKKKIMIKSWKDERLVRILHHEWIALCWTMKKNILS